MKKLAIVGGGIAGISSAYLMQDAYEVTVFEKNSYFGGNNCSVKVESSCEVPMAVIIFPNQSLFRYTLHYAKKFNLPLKRATIPHAFMHNYDLKYCFSTRYFASMNFNIRNIPRHIKDFWYLLHTFKNEIVSQNKTIVDLINNQHISDACAKYFLLPFAALYMSLPYTALIDLPISIIANWWDKYTSPISAVAKYQFIEGGNHQLINAFIRHTHAKFQLNQKIDLIERCNSHVTLHYDQMMEHFDKVIVATPADEALAILDHPTPQEKRILGNIQVGVLCSTLHTDPSLCYQGALTLNVNDQKNTLPTLMTTWGHKACFGYKLSQEHYTSIHEPNVSSVRDPYIIHQQFFKVPLPTVGTMESLAKIHDLNDNPLHTYFTGSYFRPFFYHEDALEASIAIAKLHGIMVPELLTV